MRTFVEIYKGYAIWRWSTDKYEIGETISEKEVHSFLGYRDPQALIKARNWIDFYIEAGH